MAGYTVPVAGKHYEVSEFESWPGVLRLTAGRRTLFTTPVESVPFLSVVTWSGRRGLLRHQGKPVALYRPPGSHRLLPVPWEVVPPVTVQVRRAGAAGLRDFLGALSEWPDDAGPEVLGLVADGFSLSDAVDAYGLVRRAPQS